MKNNDVLIYLEPVTKQNISMVKMMLMAFNGEILDDQLKENKALILLKGFGNRPLPTVPGFKMTLYDSEIPKFNTPNTKSDNEDVKTVLDKCANNNYKYDDSFRHFLNPNITVPTITGFLILYACYKLLELMV